MHKLLYEAGWMCRKKCNGCWNVHMRRISGCRIFCDNHYKVICANYANATPNRADMHGEIQEIMSKYL